MSNPLLDRRSFLKNMSAAAVAGAALTEVFGETRKKTDTIKLSRARTGKLNILVFFVEDQSAHLQCLGTQGIQTPHTSKLAREGVVFTNAYSTCASCAPSKASLLTGMYPHSNGHWRNTRTPNIDDPANEFTREGKYALLETVGIHEDIQTLPEILNNHGYETAITRKFHISPPWKYPFKHRLPAQASPESNGRIAKEFFDSVGDKPFFFLSQIGNSHRPFSKHIGKIPVDPVNPDRIEVPAYLPDTPDMRKDLAEYYDTVQCTDASVGTTLEALKQSGKYGNTLIIFTSDHGFCYHRAKATAYNAGIHIPFIMSGPGIPKNEVNRDLISHIDVMPTILEYLSLPVPQTVQGRSMCCLFGKGGSNWRKYVFAEHNQHEEKDEQYFPIRSVFDGRLHYLRNLTPEKKWTGSLEEIARTDVIPPEMLFTGPLDAFQRKDWDNHSFEATVSARKDFPLQYQLLEDIFNHPSEELYDLHIDPWETRNLIDNPAYATKLSELRKAVDDWMKQTKDPGADLRNIPRRTA